MENKKPRVGAIYCRVSTSEQNPKHQEDLLKNYATQQNIKVYKVYTDKISTKKYDLIMFRTNKYHIPNNINTIYALWAPKL